MGYFFKGTSLSILPIQLSSIRLRTCGWRRVEKGGEEGGAGEREREREREKAKKEVESDSFHTAEAIKKEVESDSFHTAEATAFHSDPLSHHCCWHPVLPALLPA